MAYRPLAKVGNLCGCLRLPHSPLILAKFKWKNNVRCASTTASEHRLGENNEFDSAQNKIKVVSRALEAYLNDVRAHNKMMAKERAEFELGKRHLANIMGIDPHGITQEDIDKAVEYLLPSGLTDKKALPVMKPPEEILPKIRQIAFDDEGRPLDLLFYTLTPNFYRLLSDVGMKTETLLSKKLDLIKVADDKQRKITLVGTEWITNEMLSDRLGERINEDMYAHFILAFEFLISLPCADEESDFVLGYRKAVASGTKSVLFGPKVPPVEVTEDNRRIAKAKVRVKETIGQIEVRDGGSGTFIVDGHGLDNFRSLQAREIFLAALIVTDLLGKVDVTAKVLKGPGGTSVVPRMVRHGVALGLAALFPEHFEKLRLAGLLTYDPRRRERSKINQPGARAKWIWRKR